MAHDPRQRADCGSRHPKRNEGSGAALDRITNRHSPPDRGRVGRPRITGFGAAVFMGGNMIRSPKLRKSPGETIFWDNVSNRTHKWCICGRILHDLFLFPKKTEVIQLVAHQTRQSDSVEITIPRDGFYILVENIPTGLFGATRLKIEEMLQDQDKWHVCLYYW